MRTLKLWVHNRSYNDTADDILINPKEFPDVSKGDVLEIYHPEDEFSRLLLQVTALSEDFNQKDIISIEQSIATQFQLRAYKEVHVSKVSPKDVALDLVELLFKDQYLSRSDMWRLRHGLVNTCAYLTKKIETAQMRAQVNELWAKGDRVTCGMITDDTRIVFRSSTAVVQIFIQMSSEMWDFDINGDLYFEKAVNGFLTDLFAKWKTQNCLHDVTIVLFSRTFYKATSREEFPPGVRDCIQVDYQGRFYEDFYRVLVQNERYDDWTRTIKTLRKLFNEYPQRVLNYHKVKGQKMPKAWNSTASQGNFLETLNMSLNLLEKHYVDRNFDRTGRVAVVITPGPGVFEVDRELTNITKQRTIDCGVGSDLVCMGEQPLHAAPLFKFHNRNLKATLQVGDDYNIPHWMNHSFYLSKNQIQAHLHGSFIPRIKPPQQIKEKKSKSKDKVADFPAYPLRGTPTDTDNFPFMDYDEYDAQVFKLPTRNYTLSGLKKKKKETEPRTYMEAKKAHKGRIRRSSDDMLLDRVLTSDRMEGAISIPVRSTSGDEISSSVPAGDKCHVKDLEDTSDEEGEAVRPIFGSAGSPYFHSKHLSSLSLSRRALINPFAPSTMHFKMTSNRRRWIHAFPTDPQGAAVQTHHFRTFSDNEEMEESFDLHTKETNFLSVETIKQRSLTHQDSHEGSENTSSDQLSLMGSAGNVAAAFNTSQQGFSSSLSSNTSYIQDYNLRPYRIVDSPEFREMISALDPRYQVPSRKQFAEVFIPQKYQQVKEVVKAELLSAEQVAVTTDGWTSRSTESYITVTSTHINSSWELVNYVLQTRCMPDNHTGEHIADGLREALKEWNIPEQPLYLVSDNASNMMKAGELLDCACHLGCYAHTLNLAAQKGLRIKTVSNILAKVRRIVAFFHRSAVAANLLKTQATLLGIPNKKLIIDVCTRWNSAFDMLHRYLEMQVAVVGVLMSKDLKVKDKDLKFLSDEDIKVAEEVVKCLQPLKTVTTTLCSEKVPTLSIVLPLHRQLLDHFLKVGEQDSATVKNMKSAMAADLAARYLDKVDMLTLAAVLDPRFKSLPFLSEEDRFLVYNKVVATLSRLPNQRVTVKVEPGSVSEPQPELPSLSLPSLPGLDNVDVATANSISATEKSDDIGASCTSPKKPKLDEPASLLTDILGDVYVVKVETKSPLQRAEEEVAKYKDIPVIPLSENPLKWWQKHAESYPLLSHLAKKILCIPGTSVPSERVFSTAGDIVSAQRSNLKSKHVDMLIFLKKNMK